MVVDCADDRVVVVVVVGGIVVIMCVDDRCVIAGVVGICVVMNVYVGVVVYYDPICVGISVVGGDMSVSLLLVFIYYVLFSSLLSLLALLLSRVLLRWVILL